MSDDRDDLVIGDDGVQEPGEGFDFDHMKKVVDAGNRSYGMTSIHRRSHSEMVAGIQTLAEGGGGGTGPQGPPGDSAYQVAVKNGFIGTVHAWLESLRGATGAVGPQGPVGPAGEQGRDGAAGPKGDRGDVGAVGPQGPQGVQGPQGPQGPEGDPGKDGAGVQITGTLTFPDTFAGITVKSPGDMWLLGSPVPSDAPSSAAGSPQPGDGVVWTGTAFTNVGPVRGPQGDDGPQGPQGERGETGLRGEAGPVGPQGPSGPQGQQGPAGAQGPMGAQGPQGPQGVQGPQGPAGDRALSVKNVGDGYVTQPSDAGYLITNRGQKGNIGILLGTNAAVGSRIEFANVEGSGEVDVVLTCYGKKVLVSPEDRTTLRNPGDTCVATWTGVEWLLTGDMSDTVDSRMYPSASNIRSVIPQTLTVDVAAPVTFPKQNMFYWRVRQKSMPGNWYTSNSASLVGANRTLSVYSSDFPMDSRDDYILQLSVDGINFESPGVTFRPADPLMKPNVSFKGVPVTSNGKGAVEMVVTNLDPRIDSYTVYTNAYPLASAPYSKFVNPGAGSVSLIIGPITSEVTRFDVSFEVSSFNGKAGANTGWVVSGAPVPADVVRADQEPYTEPDSVRADGGVNAYKGYATFPASRVANVSEMKVWWGATTGTGTRPSYLPNGYPKPSVDALRAGSEVQLLLGTEAAPAQWMCWVAMRIPAGDGGNGGWSAPRQVLLPKL